MDKSNDTILQLWKDNKRLFDDKNPLLLPTFCDLPESSECNLLVIGLNPSYNDKISEWVNDKKKTGEIVFPSDYNEKSMRQFYLFKDDDEDDARRQNFINIVDRISLHHHPYFSKFQDLETRILPEGQKYYHIDLYQFRQTEQLKVRDLIEGIEYIKVDGVKNRKKKVVPGMVSFFNSQLEISVDRIIRLKPNMILVANALASKIFKEKFILTKHEFEKMVEANKIDEPMVNLNELKPKKKTNNYYYKLEESWIKYISEKFFDKRTGVYEIKIDGKPTKVFFSGMLTGQRALDLNSYERLRWHMKLSYENTIHNI